MKRKVFICLLAAAILFIALPMTASANGVINMPDFKNLNGDGKYLTEQYRDNYHLDMVKLGILDAEYSIMNDLANILFMFIWFIASWTVALFHLGFSFDVSALLGDRINTIQAAMKNTVFDGFFVLVFATSAFFIIKQLIVRNVQGIFKEIGKVIVILMISMMMILESYAFLSFVNKATKEISVRAMAGISGSSMSSSGLGDYAAEASGVLWLGLVHYPWLALEFAGTHNAPGTSVTDNILSSPRGSPDRAEYIKALNQSNPELFAKEVAFDRVSLVLVLIIPLMIKCLIFIVCAALQIMLQAITMFHVLTCPIILLLAVSPALGGFDLIWKWLWRIVQTQILVLLLSFAIGLIVMFDSLIASDNNRWGWGIGLLIQIIIAVALIYFPKQLLKGFANVSSRVNSAVHSPQSAISRHFGSGDAMFQKEMVKALNEKAGGGRSSPANRRRKPVRKYTNIKPYESGQPRLVARGRFGAVALYEPASTPAKHEPRPQRPPSAAAHGYIGQAGAKRSPARYTVRHQRVYRDPHGVYSYSRVTSPDTAALITAPAHEDTRDRSNTSYSTVSGMNGSYVNSTEAALNASGTGLNIASPPKPSAATAQRPVTASAGVNASNNSAGGKNAHNAPQNPSTANPVKPGRTAETVRRPSVGVSAMDARSYTPMPASGSTAPQRPRTAIPDGRAAGASRSAGANGKPVLRRTRT